MRLAGKTALVTAAGQGIGRATALAMAAEGAQVWATDLNPKLLASYDGVAGIKAVPLDVLDKTAIGKLVATMPAVDVLFNCAGFVHSGTALQATDEEWNFALNLNVRSQFWTIQAVLPRMLAAGRGSIINMASVCSSIKGLPNRFIYGTSKAAVIGLTKSVAADFVADGIRCNALCPGHRRHAFAAGPHQRLSRSAGRAPAVHRAPTHGSAGPGPRDRAAGGVPGQRRVGVRDRPGLRGGRRHHHMNQLDFGNRHAVVTGGATGLGYAIAARLIASGGSVTLWDRDAAGDQARRGAARDARRTPSRSTCRGTHRCSRRCRPRGSTSRARRCVGQQRRHHRSQHQGLGLPGGCVAAGHGRESATACSTAAAKSCR